MAKKARKRNQALKVDAKGHVIKGVPSWIFTIVKWGMGARKIGKNLRSNVYPMLVLPHDLWVDGSTTKIFVEEKKCHRSDSYYRFSNDDVNNRYKQMNGDNFKQVSLELSKYFSLKIGGEPRLVPFLVPNQVITAKVVDVEPRQELVLGAIKPESSRRPVEFHFLDQVDSSLSHYYSIRYRETVYPVIVTVNGVKSVIYSKKSNYNINRVYDFLVSSWYQMNSEGVTSYDVPTYYNWMDIQVLESYKEIYDIAGKLDSYKMLYPNWLYDDDTNDILLSSLMYMEQDMPCFNLVLFSPTRCGKSRMLDVISKVFGEKVNTGSGQTTKGLVGSFTDKENVGAMMASNYVFLCDEYFRTELGNDANKMLTAQHIDYLMSKTIELLEHSSKTAQSGNFSRKNFFDKSFLCTNNVRDISAFNKAFNNDPASFIRYSFLSLTPKEISRVAMAFKSPPDYAKHYLSNINKAGFNTTTLAKFFRLLRFNLKWVKVTNDIFSRALRNLDYVDPNYNRKEKLVAMLKARTIMNYAIENPNPFPLKHKIKPTDKDVEEAVRFINRLTDGFKNVCGLP